MRAWQQLLSMQAYQYCEIRRLHAFLQHLRNTLLKARGSNLNSKLTFLNSSRHHIIVMIPTRVPPHHRCLALLKYSRCCRLDAEGSAPFSKK